MVRLCEELSTTWELLRYFMEDSVQLQVLEFHLCHWFVSTELVDLPQSVLCLHAGQAQARAAGWTRHGQSVNQPPQSAHARSQSASQDLMVAQF